MFSGRGGASIYGNEFDDEIHDDLKHGGEFIKYPRQSFGFLLVPIFITVRSWKEIHFIVDLDKKSVIMSVTPSAGIVTP